MTQKSAISPSISSLKLLSTSICILAALSLGACSWSEKRSEQVGTAVGGVLGVIVGSKVGQGTGRSVSAVLGGTLGAMLGQDIAKGLSNVDKIYLERTTEDTLEYGKPGETSTWSNPDSGNSGSVTADRVYTAENGEDCREFETTVYVDDEEERTATGTACKSKDGQWHVVEEPEQSS